jgi:hypothetical protein
MSTAKDPKTWAMGISDLSSISGMLRHCQGQSQLIKYIMNTLLLLLNCRNIKIIRRYFINLFLLSQY